MLCVLYYFVNLTFLRNHSILSLQVKTYRLDMF